ncbi:MAG TPA: DUF2970 domain-containing protein [Noviherbaspirillum sp.]|jgi:preprotein translocase subunit Sec61beta|uniref:DUF2970 domain-containing protein n=1 Tax=Noviherbaspirillum sp. TaxID=1926288 RepID=UPI002DDD76A5|nr:DUF2970 domain-containing protein [Noviherbaspirillum sp.]HEV2609924.1 DUF2970 domain-containing protein [Noviherbaspirillum sp.]
MDDLKKASQRKASFGATVKAVLWSFFGVRKRSEYEKDTQQLNPIHVIITGIVAAAIFVAILLLIVNAVVAN